MSKKGIISIDLTTLVGGAQLEIPTQELPREDKSQLELVVANKMIAVLKQHDPGSFEEIRSNQEDPPDIVAQYNGISMGIELTELLPSNRLEKDSILQRLRRSILSQLLLGSHSRNQVVQIFFVDNYPEKIRAKQCATALSELLNDFFQKNRNSQANHSELVVPAKLWNIISHVSIKPADLSSHPLIRSENEPLIIFGSQNTLIRPDCDIPKWLKTAINPKLLLDFSMLTWLLVWSHHAALTPVRNEIIQQMRAYLADKRSNYIRVYYFDLFPPRVLVQIPLI